MVLDNMLTVKEFDELPPEGKSIEDGELEDLKSFALENQCDSQGNYRPVLTLKNNKLKAQNFVGILETKQGRTIEILPKIDLSIDAGEVTEKEIFLNMLRTWRGSRFAQLNQSNIRALRNFNMLEVFIYLFLVDLKLLTKRGLARHYHLVEDNLPVLKGRINFPKHIITNIVDTSRFYIEYDEYSANRPANRLIHSTIELLKLKAKEPKNKQLLDQLKIYFVEIPKSKNIHDDWTKHRVDRSMQHYKVVMQWIGMFLFEYGLTTFSGKHLNQSLLFPMEEIFEDYVTHAFKNYCDYERNYSVVSQGKDPLNKHLATIGGKLAFRMKPDIGLLDVRKKPKFILDTKWKRINQEDDKHKRTYGISQGDMYQLFSYGKKYKCNSIGLIYPKTKHFRDDVKYVFDKNMELICFPFDVTKPKKSVEYIFDRLLYISS